MISFESCTKGSFIFHHSFSFSLDITFLISRRIAHFVCESSQFYAQHLGSRLRLWLADGLEHFFFTFISHKTPVIIFGVWSLHHPCHVFYSFRFIRASCRFRLDASQTPLPIFISFSRAPPGYYLFSVAY